MNILVSTISFINFNKPGAEIYATFADRLVSDVMEKTPYDVMVSTNYPEFFQEKVDKYGERIIINYDPLDNHKIAVKSFNQLLKFFAIKNIDSKYDYVLYLDCDAGLIENNIPEQINRHLNEWESLGFDAFACRTDCTFNEELDRFKTVESTQKYSDKSIFHGKFFLYPEYQEKLEKYVGACFPSEHILLLKNNHKLQTMAEIFEDFCFKYVERQDINNLICEDMEAFEIGMSAHLAGYKFKDLGSWGHHDLLKVKFNGNNWENIKL